MPDLDPPPADFQPTQPPRRSSTARKSAWRRHWRWALPLLALSLWLLNRYVIFPPRNETPVEYETPEAPPPPDAPPAPAPTATPLPLTFPTPQTRLLDPPSHDVFMATASGRIESALYGDTRQSGSAGGYRPSFHEGIDIGPMRRDRRGNALDPIYAAMPGRVGYINRAAGNSNYGIYIVLLHDDPVGEIYTLYAHLASVAPGLRTGQEVEAGETIGVMGRTPVSIIPVQRAHLHFEIGFIINRNFPGWQRARGDKVIHGIMNGINLMGIDPLKAFEARDPLGMFFMADALAAIPVALEILCRPSGLPDFFRRYPPLWKGEPFAAGAIVLGVSSSGVVLSGRNATESEARKLGRNQALALWVDREALGVHARRLAVKQGETWKLSDGGARWLSLLLHGSR